MANIYLPDDIILPIPKTREEDELFKALQDNHKQVVQSFDSIKDIEAITAGDGLTDTTNTFSVNVDDSSIETSGGDLQVKADGIGTTHISNTIAGLGLVQNGTSGALDVNVDDSSIEIDTDVVGVKDGGISTDHLATSSVVTAKILAKNVTAAKLEDDLVFATFPVTPSADPDADYEVANKQYVDKNTGGLELLVSSDFSAITSVNIERTLTAGKMYKLIYEGKADGDTGLDLALQVNGDTGNNYTYISDGQVFPASGSLTAHAEGNAGASASIVFGNATNYSASGAFQAILEVTVRNSDTMVTFTWGCSRSSGTAMESTRGMGYYDTGTPTSLQLLQASGSNNFSGTYYIYEYNKT